MASIRTLLARGKKVDPETVEMVSKLAPQVPSVGVARTLGRYCGQCGRGPLSKGQHCPHGQRRGRSMETRMEIGATKLGISADEYRAHVEAGEKWCGGHREWHARDAFFPGEQQKMGRGECRAWRQQKQVSL